MKTATLIKDRLPWATGHAALYRLSEPLVGHKDGQTASLVVVSAVHAYSGPETFIFEAKRTKPARSSTGARCREAWRAA